MSSFTTELVVSPFNSRMTLWAVKEPFEYVLGSLSEGTETVIVHTGYITDFATTSFFKFILPPTGKYGKAAVLHDYLCTDRKIRDRSTGEVVRLVSRKEADRIFLDAMGVSKVNPLVKYTLYYAVRSWAFIKGYK